ncbi:MAG: dehydrogenase, partial [Proteobacteria bacterium]|nr:dehydrogenase [Pseudomonadota bacterium]
MGDSSTLRRGATPRAASSQEKESRGAKSYPAPLLLKLYRELLFPRMIEEKMLLLLRQGRVSKWFSGIGQEAIAVGVTQALEPDEFILPLHRNLGVFTGRGMPFARLLSQWQGKENGFSHGRERSFHFGSLEHHIVGMISHLGPQLCVADGIALARTFKKEGKVTVAFTGEGGTSEGDFHEALNVAAVWNLPVIFVIENNGYALSTPPVEQYRCAALVDRAVGYGMEGVQIDGNDVLEVYRTISELAVDIRKNPRPVLVECITFRMRGHEEASGTKYVPKELMERWAKRDPIVLFEQKLLQEKVLTPALKQSMTQQIAAELDAGIEAVFAEPEIEPNNARELRDVYPPVRVFTPKRSAGEVRNLRFVDAIQDGLRVALEEHPELILMGQDIADYGGVFKVTEGLLSGFGPLRVRNTPLCESAILGAALGLGVCGLKSVVEMQFADFVSSGFNQIVNNLAKVHYRWGASADTVVRMPTGAGSGAGPFHSQSNEAWFFHVPGLKIAYPSTPAEAKGLLLAAIEDPSPV